VARKSVLIYVTAAATLPISRLPKTNCPAGGYAGVLSQYNDTDEGSVELAKILSATRHLDRPDAVSEVIDADAIVPDVTRRRRAVGTDLEAKYV